MNQSPPNFPFIDDKEHIYNKLSDNNISSIDLGWTKYTIILASSIVDSLGTELDGVTHFDKQTVEVAASLNNHTATETLIHEILHCIAATEGLDPSEGEEGMNNENIVTQMARGLMLFKNLNKDLARILLT